MRRRALTRVVAGSGVALVAAAAAALAGRPAAAPQQPKGETSPAAAGLTRYESKYYTLYTDVDRQTAHEAIVRMTAMADEYHARTRQFAGQIRRRFPFYLYTNNADYYAAGGLKGTAGVFMPAADGGGKLMATVGRRISGETWHVVQHEGFHQFAHAVIGGDIPMWLNEGLAEYFGEGLYTGDGFVVGIVPPWRLERVKTEITAGKLKPVDRIMALTNAQWNGEMDIVNYDQAWSMVHFLVHADDGRYAGPFAQCIRAISAGHSFDVAWRDAIGPTDGFEEKYKAYWLAQPRSPTHPLYVRAVVATLTSYLARATAQRQTFADLPAFVAAAGADGGLKMSPDDWLPHSLLADALQSARLDAASVAEDAAPDATAGPTWEWKVGPTKQPTLTAVDPDGTRTTGSFTLNGSRVGAVTVDVDDTVKVLADATAVRDGGDKAKARTMVTAAVRQHPRSPAAAAAQAFLKTCR